jgi:hypothetical protein
MKQLKGEKYIYALMAIELCEIEKKKGNSLCVVGNDNRMVGGYNFERKFSIGEYEGQKYLREIKSSPHCADYERFFDYNVYDSNIAIHEPTNWKH